MQAESLHPLAMVTVGMGATLLMDAWNLALKRGVGLPSLDYCMLGRWVAHMPRTFRHEAIAAAAKRPAECALGWVAHYTIGISLGVAFLLFVSADWLARPTLLAPLLYGLGTLVLPFFVMQPALGLGIASAKAARPMKARAKSMATHLVFGLGLYLGALLVSAVRTILHS